MGKHFCIVGYVRLVWFGEDQAPPTERSVFGLPDGHDVELRSP